MRLRRVAEPAVTDSKVASVVERNICTLLGIRSRDQESRGLQDRIADQITAFSGSMAFLYVHMIWFGLWISINCGWLRLGMLRVRPFDPYPFGLLTMIVSLEAIFLSTFVLISQNRMLAVADKRADLDLQINLLSEHEVTRLITLVDAMVLRMGIKDASDPEMEELERDVEPEALMEEMERLASIVHPHRHR